MFFAPFLAFYTVLFFALLTGIFFMLEIGAINYAFGALGLPWDAVVHSTRHTFCTNLGERGADAFTIMKLAGHGSIMVSQRYVHPTPARLESAIGLLESSTQSSTPT